MTKSNRIIGISFLIGLIFILLVSQLHIAQDQESNNPFPHPEQVSQQPAKQNEWIIKWKDTYSKEILKESDLLFWDDQQRVSKVRLKNGVKVNEWLEEWKDHSQIEYIQPNSIVRISQVPNDLYYSKQNYLKRINIENAWEEVNSTPELTIAIIDTGIDFQHPDLKENIVAGINLIDKQGTSQDDNGHGTNVAGIVAATGNNNLGVTGITWKAKLMPIKVLDEKGEGDSFLVGQGIRYAVDHGAKILLLSLGEPVFTPFMKEAVDYAESKNVLIVAASGNEGKDMNYPSAFPNVLSVGAINHEDLYANYSNYGQQLDVVAPGDGIYTTGLKGIYTENSGTSMAAPQVAGLAALLMQKYPDLTPSQIRDLIKLSADDVDQKGWDARTGYGKINVAKALQFPIDQLKDGWETNDAKETATIFPYNDTFRGQLSRSDDQDWYKLQLPYNGVVEFQVTLQEPLPKPIQVTIISQETNKNFVYQIKESTKISLNLPQGTSLIHIEHSEEGKGYFSGQTIDYSLKNSFRINQDQFEDNDHLWNAHLINRLDQVVKGTFHDEHDWDWYQIEVNQSGELSVKVVVDTQRLDPVIWFQEKGKKNQEIDKNGSGQEEQLKIAVTPGIYYIKLADYNGYEVVGEYHLSFQLKTKNGDLHESNDSPKQATPVDVSHMTLNGVIDDPIDQDWYRFEINHPTKVRILLNEKTQKQKIRAILYNDKLESIAEDDNTVIEWRKELPQGNYYIRVESPVAITSYQMILQDEQFNQRQEKIQTEGE